MRARGGASKSTDLVSPPREAHKVRRAFEVLGVAVLGGVVALACARWFADPAQAPRAAANVGPIAGATGGPTMEELREALERETMERQMLAAEVELMRSVLEQLVAVPPESGASVDGLEAAPAETVPAPVPGARMQFDEERLAALGMVEREIADLHRQWDRAQLAKLELRDRAMRNGNRSRPAHGTALFGVNAELRKQVGDDGYDRLLYAAGQPNRPIIRQVLGGSVAAHADLRAGDQVISYAGARVFKPAGLNLAIAMGTRGEQVQLEIDRDGERISVVVPRGPLGIFMNAIVSPPR